MNEPYPREPGKKTGFSVWKLVKRLSTLSLILGLVISNVFTLLDDRVHSLAYGLLSAALTPFATQAAMSKIGRNSPTAKAAELSASKKSLELKQQQMAKAASDRAKTVQRLTKRLGTRVVSGATRVIATLPAKAVPAVGVAVIVGTSALDIADACETIKDIQELRTNFDVDLEEREQKVCGLKLPKL